MSNMFRKAYRITLLLFLLIVPFRHAHAELTVITSPPDLTTISSGTTVTFNIQDIYFSHELSSSQFGTMMISYGDNSNSDYKTIFYSPNLGTECFTFNHTYINTGVQPITCLFWVSSGVGNAPMHNYVIYITVLPQSNNSIFSEAVSGPSVYVGAESGASIDLARIRVGDFDGNGKKDFMYINGWNSNTPATIHLSYGNGTYYQVQGPSISVGANGPYLDLSRVKTGDFNGDGRTDLLLVNGWGTTSPMNIFLANGDGSFQPARLGPSIWVANNIGGAQVDVSRVKTGDFNGDQKDDIAVIRGWGATMSSLIYLSRGDGSFATAINGPSFYVGASNDAAMLDLERVVFADVNGDHAADMLHVTGWGSNAPINVYLARGNGTFLPAEIGPSLWVANNIAGARVDIRRIKIGDFNGDGKADILMVRGWGTTSPSSLFLSIGGGRFASAVNGPSFSVGASNDGATLDLSRVRVGNFNGDLADDLLRIEGWGNTAAMSVYLANVNGSFQSVLAGPFATVASTITVAQIDVNRIFLGDFSGGGTTDIIRVNGYGNTVPISTYLSRLP